MAMDKIVIKGARANNLKNIDVTIPRDQACRADWIIRIWKVVLGF